MAGPQTDLQHPTGPRMSIDIATVSGPMIDSRVPMRSVAIYWVLLGFTGFYWVLLDFTGFYRVLLGFTRFYWRLLGFTGLGWA